MKYKGGYKYQLKDVERVKVQITLLKPIDIPFLAYRGGALFIRPGYAWDGPSGPTWDTETFMRGSLYHDAGYQLMREGFVDWKYRKTFDDILWKTCRADGMNPVRAWYVWSAVRLFGKWWAS